MYRKSFTLIEVLISIVLLLIIVVFLYETLDISEKSNKFFHQKLEKQIVKTDIKDIFFKDILSSYVEDIDIKKEDMIFSFKSSNTYHNAFYENITYLVSKENNLLRIESQKKFRKDKLYDEFFNKAFVDIIAHNVMKFKVIRKDTKEYVVYLKFKDESDMMFILKSMR